MLLILPNLILLLILLILIFIVIYFYTKIRKMLETKSQDEKDKSSSAGVIKRSDIFGESAGGAGLDDMKVKEVSV